MAESVLGKSFKATDDVLSQPVDNELVLLDLKSQRYYGLDDIGARIWQLLVELGNAEQVADRICGEYDADRERVLHDVEAMIQDFWTQGLITPGTPDIRASVGV